MNVVYNSGQYVILAFPSERAFELVDKTARRALFIQGDAAIGLRNAINGIRDEDRTEKAVDSLLDDYCAGAARPIVFH
ncbi:MAG: DUF3567 domain-containing protein [Candidatus Accumulibacter sp.]|jgi:hypothetical protein|nr:DUF3567 domain-containing protein [Accumulibacter sp.]